MHTCIDLKIIAVYKDMSPVIVSSLTDVEIANTFFNNFSEYYNSNSDTDEITDSFCGNKWHDYFILTYSNIVDICDSFEKRIKISMQERKLVYDQLKTHLKSPGCKKEIFEELRDIIRSYDELLDPNDKDSILSKREDIVKIRNWFDMIRRFTYEGNYGINFYLLVDLSY